MLFRPLRWVDIQARTLLRQKELEETNELTIDAIYECEILCQLKNCPEMAAHFENYKARDQNMRPLNPRQALYGMLCL